MKFVGMVSLLLTRTQDSTPLLSTLTVTPTLRVPCGEKSRWFGAFETRWTVTSMCLFDSGKMPYQPLFALFHHSIMVPDKNGLGQYCKPVHPMFAGLDLPDKFYFGAFRRRIPTEVTRPATLQISGHHNRQTVIGQDFSDPQIQ
jgi:hypothetical protein